MEGRWNILLSIYLTAGVPRATPVAFLRTSLHIYFISYAPRATPDVSLGYLFIKLSNCGCDAGYARSFFGVVFIYLSINLTSVAPWVRPEISLENLFIYLLNFCCASENEHGFVRVYIYIYIFIFVCTAGYARNLVTLFIYQFIYFRLPCGLRPPFFYKIC